MTLIKKFTPAVKKKWLYLLSGLSWSAVGIYLASLTTSWFPMISQFGVIWRIALGLILASAIFLFGFTRFAKSNITRIQDKPLDKMCVFGFQKWSSYPLVVVMISLGIFLRKYSPIPKNLLAILYIGIGGGLLFSSYWYYDKLVKLRKTTKAAEAP